ncbi:MAG TPA: GntR family transcriptional regulator, partial [Mycobacterium sp.]
MTLTDLSFGDTVASAETNAGRAYEIVRERLVMLDIRPGEPINDDHLAGELGVGRTPVREALKHLERDRLVIAYPRRGTFATVVDMTDLADISEIRKQLE